MGIKESAFGNAARGSWDGNYRKLIIQDNSGHQQIVGLAIYASAKDHPSFPNSKGYTYLIVSLEDESTIPPKSHNSLQLNLDKHVRITPGGYEIFHDGKLTHSNKGSLKFSYVKDCIKELAPSLITEHDEIKLGSLRDNRLFTNEDQGAIMFLQNLITYAVARDEIRSKQ